MASFLKKNDKRNLCYAITFQKKKERKNYRINKNDEFFNYDLAEIIKKEGTLDSIKIVGVSKEYERFGAFSLD